MVTLEEIKKKKLDEMMLQQQNMQQNIQDQAKIQQQIEQLESIISQFLTREALVRYGSLKAAHPEKATQLLVLLVQAIQSGRIKSQIDDASLKKVLQQITPRQRDIKIKRV